MANYQHKRSPVAGKIPLAGDLLEGEIAVNIKDRKLFAKDDQGTVFEFLGGNSGGVDTVNGVSPVAGNVTLNALNIPPTADRLWLSQAERLKLSGIEEGAETNTVITVAGKVGDVDIDLSDIKTNGGTADTVISAQLIAQGYSGNYGFFEEGFTYSVEGDIGIDADGNSWIYVGTGAPNKVVSAGTVPSVSAGYEQVTYNSASNISNASGGSVQDFLDSPTADRVSMEAATLGTPATASNDHALFKSTYGPFRMHMEPDRPIENGTCSKLDWMLDPYDGGPLVPYPNPDVNYRIFNVFTKTGDEIGLNGENGAAVIGTKNRADGETWGVFTSMHFGFNDGKSVPMKMYYMDHSDTEWRTPMKNFWYTGKPLNANDYVLSGRKLYKCLTAGVCGSTQPVHLSGTVSDGNLDFEFVRNYLDHINDIGSTVLFGTRDLMPKFGHQENPVQFAAEPMIWAGVRTKHLSAGQQTGFGLVKSGVRTDAEAWQLEFYNNNRFRVYENRYSTVGIVKQYNTVVLTDADIVSGQLQVPAGCEQVEVNLLTPTSISSISPLVGHQHITIIDIAGNLTLVDSTKIKTRDGLNLTMRAGTGRVFAASLGGTLIREL